MPSAALTTAEDKNKVRRALPTAKIYAATVARLYVAYPNPHKWAYSNIWGAVAFLKDKKKHSLYIRIVDLTQHKGVIWEQELYDDFEFTQQTPFFFTFAADEYMAGLSFSNDEDAATFFSKVVTREKEKPAKKKKAKETSGKKPTRGKLNKTQIGLPSEFRHLGHIGYTPEKGFSVQNTDSEWNGLFDELQSLGISASEINENQDFIKDFVNQRGGPPVPPAPPARPSSTAKKSRPPPPPPSRRAAPPPPVGGRRPPPPPPPPASSRRNVPAPPPPPVRPAAHQHITPPRATLPPPPPPVVTTPIRQQQTYESSPVTSATDRSTDYELPQPSPATPQRPVVPLPSIPAGYDNQDHYQVQKSNNPYRASASISATPPPAPPVITHTSPTNAVPPTPPVSTSMDSFDDAYDNDTRASSPEFFDASEAPPPPPPLPGRDRRGAPPPPPLPGRNMRGPPPPPPTASRPAQPKRPSVAPPPPPPAPPVTTSAVPPPPPPPPAPPLMTNTVPPPPPPPAPPMTASAAPPPPPPAPPMTNSTVPPPPPPAPSTPTSNATPGERGALLDSIRSAGGIGSLKKTPKELQRDRSGPSSGTSSMATGAGVGAAAGAVGGQLGGDDLTSSLFTALQNRKKSVLADDDDDLEDEDSDGSEWE